MLKLIRGATQSIIVTIEDNDGNIYKLKSGDVLKFGIKRYWQNAEYDVYKEVTSADIHEDGYVIDLAPEDTKDVIPGRDYKFDIGLQTAAGDYYMVVPCSSCVIMPNITAKEDKG